MHLVRGDRPFSLQQGTLDQILQFQQVARPAVQTQGVEGADVEGPPGEPLGARQPVGEVFHQLRQVVEALAQGRYFDGGQIKALRQLGQKILVVGQGRVAQSEQAHIQLHGSLRSRSFEGPFLQQPQQCALPLGIQPVDVVDHQRAAIDPGQLTQLRGAVLTGLPQPAGLFGIELLGIHHQQRTLLAGTLSMHGAGELVAATAALAQQQYRHGVAGQPLGIGPQRLHGAALADQLAIPVALAVQLALAPGQFQVLERPFGGHQQAIEGDGFFQKIPCAEAGGFHGGGDGAVAGDHDHVGVGQQSFVLHLAQQGDAVDVRHPYVEKDYVRHLRAPRLARLHAVGGGGDPVAFVLENFADQFADVPFVIHDQNVAAVTAHRVWVRGKVIIKQVRCPLRVTCIVPLCSSTIFLTTASPSPVPLGLSVA